jgi:hypothetical protein
MEKHTKMMIGFLVIIFSCIVQMSISYVVQREMYALTYELKDVQAPLALAVSRASGYSIMLTEEAHGALIHAQRGEYEDVQEHKEVFLELHSRLDDLLQHKLAILLNQSKILPDMKIDVEKHFNVIREVQPKMTAMELQGFEAIEKKDLVLAQSFLIGGLHKEYKAVLFDSFLEWADHEEVAIDTVGGGVLKESNTLIYLNVLFSMVNIVLLIVTMLSMRSFVYSLERGAVKV